MKLTLTKSSVESLPPAPEGKSQELYQSFATSLFSLCSGDHRLSTCVPADCFVITCQHKIRKRFLWRHQRRVTLGRTGVFEHALSSVAYLRPTRTSMSCGSALA